MEKKNEIKREIGNGKWKVGQGGILCQGDVNWVAVSSLMEYDGLLKNLKFFFFPNLMLEEFEVIIVDDDQLFLQSHKKKERVIHGLKRENDLKFNPCQIRHIIRVRQSFGLNSIFLSDSWHKTYFFVLPIK